MRHLFFMLWLAFLPLAAQAGPWPRDTGSWFVSTAYGQERAVSRWRHFAEIYAEYGATERLTLAAQLRHGAGGRYGDLLARWHPGTGGNAPPFGLGAGLRLQPGGTDQALLLLAAHLGHGFDIQGRNAWTRLDLQMQARPAQPLSPIEWSLSGQLGLRDARGLIGMVSVTGKRRNGASLFEVSPAIGHEIGRRHTLVLSLTATPSAPQMRSAQLSLWSRF